MSGIALPLRIGAGGQFARADRVDALLDVMRVMILSTPGTWPHAPWFGLLHQWESAKPNVDDHPALAEALNIAIRRLGIEWAEVSAVRRSAASHGERAFDLTLRIEGRETTYRRLEE